MSRGNATAPQLLMAVAVAALMLVGGVVRGGASAHAQSLLETNVSADGCGASADVSLGREVGKTVSPNSVLTADWVRDAAPASSGEASPLAGVWPSTDAAPQLTSCPSVVPGVPTEATGMSGTATLASEHNELIYDLAWSFVAPNTTGIRQINGRNPINSSYAGRAYDGPGWTADLAAKYPNGVRFNDAGFPDFSPHSRARVQFDDLTGTYATDAAAANRALNLSGTPSGHVWHHVEDGTTMILIPQDIHSAVRHTGGAAVIRGGG